MVKKDTKVRLQAHGLRNKGNDCFFNSVMQSVLSVTDLTTFYRDTEFREKQILSLAFQSFIKDYESSNVLSPDPFINALRPKIKFLNGRQQDSHEFLILFINLLFKELSHTNKEVISSKEEYFAIKGMNLIADLFFGLQQTTVVCGTCLYKSTSPSHFTILSLPVTNDINESLSSYFKETVLQGKDEFNCEKCKFSKITKHSIEIIYYPKVLVIQLMRFDGAFRKNDNPVNIPKEISLNKENYSVIGMTCHSGVLSSGHYVSFSNRNAHWYKFDDSYVTKVEYPPLKGSDAYLVFYEKR